MSLRIIYFDYSGEIISIKCRHPFESSRKFPTIEFPKEYITGFKLKKTVFAYKLKISIRRESGKLIHKNLKLKAFQEVQIEELRKVFNLNLQEKAMDKRMSEKRENRLLN